MPWQVYNSAGQLLQATDLVDGTVTASKLDTNAVTNAKVADDAIGVVELSATGTASSSTFLRGDNAWAAPGGGPSQAVQSAIEAETNEDTYIPPDLVRNSPGVAKVLASVTGTGDSYIQSYNLDGITDTATGIRTHTITTDFAANTYQVIGGSRQHSGTRTIYHTLAAGSFIERVQDPDTAADSDLPTSIAAFGAQV